MEERRRTRHWLDYSITYMMPMPEGCESRGRSQRCFFLWPDMRRLRSRRQEHSGVDNASVKASQAVLLLSSKKLSTGFFFVVLSSPPREQSERTNRSRLVGRWLTEKAEGGMMAERKTRPV